LDGVESWRYLGLSLMEANRRMGDVMHLFISWRKLPPDLIKRRIKKYPKAYSILKG
jgi:hypothetical protein